MHNRILMGVGLGLMLAACGASEEATAPKEIIADIDQANASEAPQANFGFWQAKEPSYFGENAPSGKEIVPSTGTNLETAEGEGERSRPEAGVQQSRIAYTYGFGFEIGNDKIVELQNAHISICESLEQECRVLRSSQAAADSYDGYGELQLQVAAKRAASFSSSLTKPATDLGGALVSSVRDGEDLSEQIIDNEARLSSRLVLRDKLTSILRKSTGSVDELVKAEKAVAEVNEEIDATRSKLKAFRNRIQFSNVNIEYQPEYGQSQLGFSRPIATAFRSIGTTLGTTIAVLIYGLTILVPILALLLAIRWILHRFDIRMRFWKNKSNPAKPIKPSETN